VTNLFVVEGKAWAVLEQVQLKPVQLVEGRYGVSLVSVTRAHLSPLEAMDAVSCVQIRQ